MLAKLRVALQAIGVDLDDLVALTEDVLEDASRRGARGNVTVAEVSKILEQLKTAQGLSAETRREVARNAKQVVTGRLSCSRAALHDPSVMFKSPRRVECPLFFCQCSCHSRPPLQVVSELFGFQHAIADCKRFPSTHVSAVQARVIEGSRTAEVTCDPPHPHSILMHRPLLVHSSV